jgi:CHAT domain-containing protein
MRRGIVLGAVVVWAGLATAAEPELTAAERQRLAQEARRRDDEAERLVRGEKVAEAAALLERNLQLRRRLYPTDRFPQGHPDLASNLNNLGFVLNTLGRPEKALPLYEQALAMRRRLYSEERYPNGHPHLLHTLITGGSLLDSLGAPEEALPYYEQALTLSNRLVEWQAAAAPEADALQFIRTLPSARDAYLSLARRLGRLAGPAAGELSRRVWQPVAKCLPAETDVVYVSPDGALWGLPWAALPGPRHGTVLLEGYALAVVPHAPFLLEKLLDPPPNPSSQTVLALGGVHYASGAAGAGPYAYLDGTAREVAQLRAVAGRRPVVVLGGRDATVGRLREELPKARYAHLATHGFFDAKSLTRERRDAERQREQLRSGYRFEEGRSTPPAGIGGRSPLGYVGLALAGANEPERAEENGVLTGEGLVGLPLEGLELAVLSACETGLGEWTAGEGLQGLVRAFHLAGCANVVASLWQVEDEATAALFAQFYHELWANQKPPLEALRAAQLTVCLHPERIPALARKRGPALTAAVELPSPASPAEVKAGRRSDAKLWAGFVLSGPGR